MKYDLQVILATLIILLMGLLIQYSIAPGNINYHLIYICIGIVGGVISSRVDRHLLRAFAKHLYLLGIGLLILTLLVATVTRGSRRWIDFGLFQFQPSELFKLIMIITLPEWLTSVSLTQIVALVRMMILVGLPVGLILIQPDLGTALIVIIISMVMIFVNGIKPKFIGIGIVICLLMSPVVWFNLKDYQKDRIHTFMDPLSDPLGKGYNSIQSQIAVGSGQILGRGLGHGTQSKLRFLPESKTDFVFASLAEELGLLGSIILLLAFTWLIIRLFTLAITSSNPYDMTVLIGVAIMLLSQTVINVGMNTGILPVTGITLPFVSAGGTSLVISLVSIGLALGIAQKTKTIQGIEISGKDK